MEKKTGFKRYLIGACLLVFTCTTVSARARQFGYCEQGGQKVTTAGTRSSTLVQSSNPGCLVTVFASDGITLASLFSDNSGTPLGNPFQADTLSGYWDFYADNGRYNVQLSGGTVQGTIVLGDIILTDPAAGGFVPGGPAGGDLAGTYPNPTVPAVHFIQPGTGAVSRLVNNRLLDTVSVIDFGADKTGVASSSEAFNNAAAMSATRGGLALYVPCGTYLFSSTVTVNSPATSLIGENESCVVFRYPGSGSGIVWQISPFTVTPAGEFSNFTLLGTSAAQNGILSGQIVSSHWRNIAVGGFTGAGAAAIRLHNAGNGITWTERNLFENVSVGGVASPAGVFYNTNGFVLDSDNIIDSFGYNRFLDIKMNVSTGQVGFNFQNGFFYNSVFTAICNSDNNLAGSVGPICVRSNSNWDSNLTQLNGEFQNTGVGTGTDYAVQVEAGAKFNGWGHVTVFNPGGTIAPVNNLSGVLTNIPNVSVSQGYQTAWDTGTFTLPTYGGVGSPEPAYRATDGLGSVGVLVGSNFSSPYVSMFNESHNAFVVGVVNPTQPIGSMTPVFTVDAGGSTATLSHLWAGFATSSLGTVDPNVLSDINGIMAVRGSQGHYTTGQNGSLRVGGFVASGKAGWTNIGLWPTPGYNESIEFGGNSGSGYGVFTGTNLEHPVMWGLDTDTVLWSLHKKTVGAPISDANRVALIDANANYIQKGPAIRINDATVAVTWSTGSGAPAGACQAGNLYSNFAGGASTTFYVCEAGAWVAK